MLIVTCAIIRNEENEILIVQGGEATDHPFKWEFPGGKLDTGESEDECIIREIKEELSMDIVICKKLQEVEYDYGHKLIRLIPFVCDTLDENPTLTEHIAFRWVKEKELISYDFSEADVFVAENYLEESKPGDLNTDKIVAQTEKLKEKELQEIVNNMMSMEEAEWVALSAIENPAVFSKLYEYSFSSDPKLAFRASWTLTKVCDKFPEIIYPYLPEIIETLNKIDNVSTLRSFLRIIAFSDLNNISSRQHGLLADFGFNILNSVYSAIAVKAYSMEILYKLTLIYPELGNELSTSILSLMDEGSAGIKSRGRAILRKLVDMPVNRTKK